MLLLGLELWEALGRDPLRPGWRPAVASAVLLACCPYASLHQRLAMVEPLFLLEAAAVAWLSLRISGRARWSTAVALGFWMGATMLTRQDLSYLLWALPVLSFCLRAPERREPAVRWARMITTAAVLSLVIWLPMLLARSGPDLFDRIFHSHVLVEPMGLSERISMSLANAVALTGWLWTYLTPPVLLFAVGALVWLSSCGQWRIAVFVTAWLALTMAPLVIFGRFLFSRYGIVAVIPALLVAGIALGEMPRARGKTEAGRVRMAKGLVLVALCTWPAYSIFLQATRWREQQLVALDRWQLVSGWPAGYSTEQAIRYLSDLTSLQPIVLLVPRNEGNPMDALWLAFGTRRSVTCYSVGDASTQPLLRAGASQGGLLLDSDPRLGEPPQSVALPAGTPVYTVSPDPILTLGRRVSSTTLLAERNPTIREVARFWNPPPSGSGMPTDGVVVYRVR
jgi:hypothetical protein